MSRRLKGCGSRPGDEEGLDEGTREQTGVGGLVGGREAVDTRQEERRGEESCSVFKEMKFIS